MKLRFFLPVFVFIIISAAAAAAEIPQGSIAVFPRFTGNYVIDDILKNSELRILDVLNSTGRFIPVEYNRKIEYMKRTEGKDAFDLFNQASARMNLKIYIVLEASGRPGNFTLSMSVYPVNDQFKKFKKRIILHSGIPVNLPLKAARETALMLSSMRLRATVKSVDSRRRAIIDAGQWHGLHDGIFSTASGNVTVLETGRYVSVAAAQGMKTGDVVVFDLFPRSALLVDDLEREMVENAVKKYGPDRELDKRNGAAKESALATCIINPGASILLPGYGSHLSMEYLGLKNSKIDGTGVLLGFSLVGLHFLLPSMMNDYDVNFFPWIQDGDKSDRTQRLQIFLWASLPLTYTATFYDQLSSQYSRRGLLPPLFEDRDSVSALVSLFVPGGGMFYKGWRKTGWAFYFSEMGLAGYGIYHADQIEGKYALGAFAGVKVIDLLFSYFAEPSYGAYKKNISSDMSGCRFDLRLAQGPDQREEVFAGLIKSF